MADQVSSKVVELSWSIGKFLLKASGSGLLADAGETAGKAYKLVRSLIENSGSDVNNDVAEQINKVLTSKIRSMYGRPAVNKELLEVAATEVKLLLDQITDDDKLLVVAVKNPDSFSDLLRKLAYARQLEIEQEAESYFNELVDVVKKQYVKVAPRSSEFDKAALKDLFALNEQESTKLNQICELLEDTNKEVKNSNAKLDYVKKGIDVLSERLVADTASNVSVQKPVIFGMRPDIAAFYIERGERERLRNLVKEDPRLRVVLVGMRGCGKSQLASELAWSCEEKKWHLVAWIDATSKEQVRSGLIELADRLGIETQGRNEESIIEQCFSYLESGEPSDRLIVFDNVKDINDLIKLVPRGDGLRVVVTTTNDCGWKNQSWDSIKIGVFSREDSIKCLLRITDSEDLEAADAVAQKLGDLPLAIAQAGATACAEDWTLKKYLVRLKRYSSSIVIKPVRGDSYTEDVSKALLMAVDAALDKLGDNECEVARRQLGGLAVLAQSGVPTRWIDPLSPDAYNADREENVPDIADENAHSALTALVNMSVVQQSADKAKTITMLHRLQAQVLREKWDAETATCEEAFDAAVEILGRTKYEQLPSNATDARRREVSDLIAQLSAIAVQDYSRSLFESEQIRLYLYRAFKYGHDLGIEYKTVELSEAVGVIEDVLGADHPVTLTVRNNLAGAYKSAGRLAEAIELFKQVLAERERVLEADHPDTLTVRNNLASAYESVGRFGEAIELFKQVLAERERVLGADHPDTLTVRNNLAGAYESVGRFGEAIELYEQVLAERERVLGADHPDTLTVRNNLAGAYESVGRFGEAIELYEQVLAERERVLEADHPDTLTVRNNLASAYESVGRFGEAIDAWEELLLDCQRVLGADHPVTLTVRNNLAVAYRSVGRFGEAIELFEQVLADRVRVLGPDHPDTLTTRHNLASAYGDVGRFGEAIELFEQVLAEYERVLGADHPDTLTVRNNLAGAYYSVGRFGEAIELFEQVLAEYERVLGADHPDTLNTRNNLALAYKSVGRFGEAIELFEQVLAERERVLGADHPDTLNTRNSLAGAYDSVGRFGEAIDAWEELLLDCQRVLGADHPDTLGVRNNLAVAYDSVGRLAEAIDAWEELLPDCQRVLGADHPDTLAVCDNLAVAYDSVGRLAEAIDAWEELLPDCQRVLGADHPDTLTVRNSLAVAYDSAGRLAEAIDELEELLLDCQRVLGLEHPLTKQVEKNLEAAKRKMKPPAASSE